MQAPTAALVLAFVLPLLAGCLATAPADTAPAVSDRLPLGQPTRAEIDARTVEEPPVFHVGQWWQYRFDHDLTGISRLVTLVAAGAEGDELLVGMPVDAFDDAVLVTHMPPVGTVGRGDWGYDVGGVRFIPLEFPLYEGKSWETSWQSPAEVLVAVVKDVDGQTATIEMVGPTRTATLTYDARTGAIREFDMRGYGGYEMLDYGYGYAGEIAVPSLAAPVFRESRVQALLDGDSNPAAPVATIHVDGPYDHISVLMMAGPQLQRLPGAYRLEAVAPDGEPFVMTSAPPESGTLRWRIFHHDAVVGDWDVSWVVVGHGFGLFEGTAYDARHFLLDGDERPEPVAATGATAAPGRHA